jgi:hypothetical protein
MERTGIEPVTSGLQNLHFVMRQGRTASGWPRSFWFAEVQSGYSGTRFGTVIARGNFFDCRAAYVEPPQTKSKLPAPRVSHHARSTEPGVTGHGAQPTRVNAVSRVDLAGAAALAEWIR